MHKTSIVMVLGLATALAIYAFGGDENRNAEAPTSAVIIIQGVHSRAGVGRMDAISIVDRTTSAKLAAFFPNFENRPSSDHAGGWDAGYRIFLNFKNGRAIRVTVSMNGDTWSTGDGDFETQGDFAAFVEELKRRAAR